MRPSNRRTPDRQTPSSREEKQELKDLIMRQLELAWKISEDNVFFKRLNEEDKLKYLMKIARKIDSFIEEEASSPAPDVSKYGRPW